MTTHSPIDVRFATAADPAAPVRRFVVDHRDALWKAARLLGGHEAARKVATLADALAVEPRPTRITTRRLRDLQNLVTLRNVHDPERVEMGCSAVIDPADPVVEEICLLADGLSEALGDWDLARSASARPDGGDRLVRAS